MFLPVSPVTHASHQRLPVRVPPHGVRALRDEWPRKLPGVQDPYHVQVDTARLSRMSAALDVVDEHAELNHRYRRLITDSRHAMSGETVRLTQARGIAKKLMVLVKAAGTDFADRLPAAERRTLTEGLEQADELVYADEA